MRNLAVSIVLAVACLLAEASGVLADHPIDTAGIGVLYADTTCPAATHSLVECPYYSTVPFAYLAFDQQKGKPKNLVGGWVLVTGVQDLETCAPKVLIRVRSIEKSPLIPLCP